MVNVKEEKTSREPLFHIAKRNKLPWWKGLLIRIGAVVAAIVICLLFAYLFVKVSPADVADAFISGNFGDIKSILNGKYSSLRRVFYLFKDVSLLLLIGLALTPAFKMRFWNIGGNGQALVGALAAIACAYYLGGNIAEPILLIIMLIAAMIAGALWGFIPAIFKAMWNTNETLFTLMMNYIAIETVNLMIAIWEPRDNTLEALNYGILNFFPNLKLFARPVGKELTVTLIAIVAMVIMYIYLKYSKQGYEISVVGESENTARYIGINVKKVIIRTMIISGALCGLVGFLIASVFDNSISKDTINNLGFTAIMVSWLGKFNPFIMAGMAFIISFLNIGSAQLVNDLSSRGMGSGAASGISPDFPNVIVGIMLFFIVGCEFFINYRIKVRSRSSKGGKK